MGRVSTEEHDRRKAEAEAKIGESSRKAADDQGGIDTSVPNPREPVDQAREGAKPMTVAAGGLPVGTPGTVEPVSVEDVVDRRIVASARVPMASVRIIRTYFAKPDGQRLAAGTETELPKEEARLLIESGIAEFIDHVNEPVAE